MIKEMDETVGSSTICQFTGKRMLSGEIYASNLQRIKRATKKQLAIYLKNRQSLETRKFNADGVIGVHKKEGLFFCDICEIDAYLTFSNPLGACEFYNRYKSALYGDQAVLCDPLGVVRKWLMPKPKSQKRGWE